MDETEIMNLIKKKSEELHIEVGKTIDKFIIDEKLREDAITLNIIFNALANNIGAIVRNNYDIPLESVELMIQSVTRQIRKGYANRIANKN